jgi:hypothetical protein
MEAAQEKNTLKKGAVFTRRLGRQGSGAALGM